MADRGSSLLNPIERLLGPDARPDPAFFIDSWTLGAAAASENYQRRRQQNLPEPQESARSPFRPYFVADPAVPVSALPREQALWPPLHEPRPVQPPLRSSEADAPDDANEAVPRPRTIEAACRLLGVTPASSREQIKLAYRKMASRYHPDRIECGSLRDQQRATERMASINEAHRLLCDCCCAQSA